MSNVVVKKKKKVHIVFRVLNFLCSNHPIAHEISSNASRLLIILARCYGSRGIVPSKGYLENCLKISTPTIPRLIRELKHHNLIEVNYIPGIVNSYSLSIPCPNNPEKLYTTPLNTDRGRGRLTPITSDMTPLSKMNDTPITSDMTYINNPNQSIINPERAVAKKHCSRSTLSDFSPSKENVQLAQRLNVNLEGEIKSFKNKYSGKGKDLQYEFERWLKYAAEYAVKKNGNVIPMQTAGAAYRDFVPMPKVENPAPMPDDLRQMMGKIKRVNV